MKKLLNKYSGLSKTRGYVATDDTNKMIVVAFQGTEIFDDNPADILTDIDLVRVKTNFCGTANTNDGCEIHMGFKNAATDVQDVVSGAVTAALASHPGYRVVVTGQSLGGAVAALTATLLRNSGQVTDLVSHVTLTLTSTDCSEVHFRTASSRHSRHIELHTIPSPSFRS